MSSRFLTRAAVAIAAAGVATFIGTSTASAEHVDGGLVNVSPVVQTDVCGNAVAVVGVAGAASDCNTQQSADTGGDGALINVEPVVQTDVCGNAVAVVGVAGAASRCGRTDDGHDGPPHQPPGGGKPSTGDKPNDGGVTTGPSGSSVTRPVASVESPASRAGGPLGGMLPFTGGELLTLAGIGAGLTGAGGALWRFRRTG
jgi:hypothetical protein